MKICILTQPLSYNYGGILQAYALQTVLKRMGHEVWTEDRKPAKPSILDKLKQNQIIRRIARKKKLVRPNKMMKSIIYQHTARFIRDNIRLTVVIDDFNKSELKKYGFDVYVVGSDQVWRPCYSPNIYNYFLDFTHGEEVKRIAYAASFGVDNWEYSKKQTYRCLNLISHFDAVSVREDTGVTLCETHLDTSVVHVLDPTMLLDQGVYINLVSKDNISPSLGDLMVYVLDRTEGKKNIIKKIADYLKLQMFEAMPACELINENFNNIEDCTYPPVTKWLRGFMDAKFVVTDSFHGCVFAIIFEKPFIAIVNEARGAARFSSLLKSFELTERAVKSLEDITVQLIHSSIDWDRIRKIRLNKIQESITFLEKNLNEKC